VAWRLLRARGLKIDRLTDAQSHYMAHWQLEE